jgi:hypothetical protein
MPNVQGTWLNDALRISAFFAPGTVETTNLNLLEIYGVDPASITVAGSPKTRFETGSLGVGHLQLSVQVERIDVNWTAVPSVEGEPAGLGELDEALNALALPFVKALGRTGQPFHRLAIGGIRVFDTEDRAAVFAKLREVFPKLDLGGEFEDFFMSLNRPTSTEIDGRHFKVNRIFRWSERQSGPQITVTPTGAVHSTPGRRAAGVEFDINTHQDNAVAFTEESIEVVFNALRHELEFTIAVPANV